MLSSKFQFSEPKIIKNGISFNLIFGDNLYLVGFRITKGSISPPQTLSKTGKYYPLVFFSRLQAEEMYDKIVEMQWKEKYGINLYDKERAILDILISSGKFGAYYG